MRVLAIDQGTTSTRGLVFEDDKPPRIVGSLRHRQMFPQPGWVEHDPLEILQNIRSCLEEAGPVDAMGIANQGESCMAWDAITKQPLSPIIVWQDRRTEGAIARLKAGGAEPRARALCGLPMDSYFAASKLAWLLETNAQVQAAGREGRLRLATTDAFWLDRLAGVYATDATTASRTGLMNLHGLAWDETLCEMYGVPMELLPPIRPTVGDFGACGAIPLRASVVDQQAALFGHGCRNPGDAKITFGTGAFALAVAGDTAPEADADGLIATLAWQSEVFGTRYAVEASVFDAGAAVEWGKNIGLLDEFAELDAFVEPPAIGRGLVFVPALSGLACPQWDRSATGVWMGMNAATTRRDLQQSILEGVALQTREVVDALGQRVALGDVLRVDGGLSASRYFLQFLADVTGKTVMRCENVELTAYGCALLAGAAPVVNRGESIDAFCGSATRLSWIDRYRKACAVSVGTGSDGLRCANPSYRGVYLPMARAPSLVCTSIARSS